MFEETCGWFLLLLQPSKYTKNTDFPLMQDAYRHLLNCFFCFNWSFIVSTISSFTRGEIFVHGTSQVQGKRRSLIHCLSLVHITHNSYTYLNTSLGKYPAKKERTKHCLQADTRKQKLFALKMNLEDLAFIQLALDCISHPTRSSPTS